MNLNDVHQGIQKRRKRKRIGRGPGSGHGKTAGRGHKGFKSRAGSSRRRAFEGGQMPLARRIAKRGFSNVAFARRVAIINLHTLDHAFENGDTVDIESLTDKGLVKNQFQVVKVLGDGELTKKLNVKVHRCSRSAEDKITARGGTVERIVLA